MANENRPKPNAWQYIKYSYGGRLPDSMRAWVTEDLIGKGATLRVVIRMFVPAFLILIPIWFAPELLGIHTTGSTLVVRLSTTVPILIPVIYFSHALNKIWRRNVLVKHGIDPKCLEDALRQKNAHIHAAYEERYGRRSDDGTGSSTTI